MAEGLALTKAQMPEYISQLGSSAWFLAHMRDKHKPGSPLYMQFQLELSQCIAQKARIERAFEQVNSIS